MDVIFDWNLGNMIYNGLITLRLCGFPFAEIRSFHGPLLRPAQLCLAAGSRASPSLSRWLTTPPHLSGVSSSSISCSARTPSLPSLPPLLPHGGVLPTSPRLINTDARARAASLSCLTASFPPRLELVATVALAPPPPSASSCCRAPLLVPRSRFRFR